MSQNCRTDCSPTPSMSAAACTQLISDSSPREGQALFGQRCIASPSGFTMSAPQSGHCFGILNGFVPGWCSPAGPTICGMTSPARCTTTTSPSRMSLRLMSSSLCSVAPDGDAADLDGFEHRPRIERAGPPHADRDLLQLGRRGHRRPLERTGPARPLVQRSKAALLLERVDLDDDPVDLVVELDAPLLPFRAR